jgi:putative aminopeptidase FrvX
MLLDSLQGTLPEIPNALNSHPVLNSTDKIWAYLRRLLLAHAPSGGSCLPGAIADDIASIAGDLGLAERFEYNLLRTGNPAVWLGAQKPTADAIVVTHMDRPTFRVRSLEKETLYPICANRFPDGVYRVGAKSLRFEQGKLTVGARGSLISERNNGQETLRFKGQQGELAWHDFITMDVDPQLNGVNITASGLDNCLGTLVVLLTAALLKAIEEKLVQHERCCLFVFTDLEEGPPDAFFGHGAARLTHALPPPTFGCIVADAQTAGPGYMPVPGQGTSHGFASSNGRGSVVPPHYQALAVHLSEEMNVARPETVQMNFGYISRSDDMALGRWTRILALSGPPMQDAHTGHESANLRDIQAGVWWLSHFIPAVLNVVPEITRLYALGR